MELTTESCGPGFRLVVDICEVAPPGYVETRSECEIGVDSKRGSRCGAGLSGRACKMQGARRIIVRYLAFQLAGVAVCGCALADLWKFHGTDRIAAVGQESKDMMSLQYSITFPKPLFFAPRLILGITHSGRPSVVLDCLSQASGCPVLDETLPSWLSANLHVLL